MKRILLIGILVILLALTLPATVSAGTTGSATVAGNVKESIELTMSGSIASWQLVVGDLSDNENTVAVDMNVKSTASWDVKVADKLIESKPAGSAGKMVNYTAGAYGPGSEALLNALKVKSGSGVYVTLSAADQAIQTGLATATSDYDIGLKQKVEYGDKKVPTGSSYRIVVTFTGSNT
jgi:hypothetical protein